MAKNKRLVVDETTGEVVDTLLSGDRISRAKSIEYMFNNPQASENEQFAKFWNRASDALSRCEYMNIVSRVCMRLMPYIRYDSGVLAYSNGVLLDIGSIQKICEDMDERSVRRAMAHLVSDSVYAKVTKEPPPRYIANPYIFMRGKRVSRTLVELFKDTKWAGLYPNPLFFLGDIHLDM